MKATVCHLLLSGLLGWLTNLPVSAQSFDVKKLITSKKGYEQNTFPASSFASGFAVVEPGVALVPAQGGIYIAGLQSWYLLPSSVNRPFAVDYCRVDSSLYFFTTNKTRSHLLKLSGSQATPKFTKILEMPLGAYGFRAISPRVIWIWGAQGDKWRVWKYDFRELIPVFETAMAITDVAALNEQDVVVAAGSSIIALGTRHAPKELIKMDVGIDGLAVATDGTLYVSTTKGVLHYLLPEFVEDAEIITYGIHGKLKRYKNSLFVLWQENNQVVEIKL